MYLEILKVGAPHFFRIMKHVFLSYKTGLKNNNTILTLLFNCPYHLPTWQQRFLVMLLSQPIDTSLV